MKSHNTRFHNIGKTTFREIKSSFGRFFAIFAIVALGVGFFAGLKVTKSAMTATVEGYLDRHGFYDLRLLSTYGFEQEDVEFFAGRQGVEAAAGGISFDVLYRKEDGSQGVARTYSLTEELNTVKLVAGRMPAQPDECVVDSSNFGEDAVGSLLCLSEDNAEEDLEHFAHRAYRIVGLVQSPLYLQYERGNTSLGSGRVDGFVCLLEDGFDTEYFTEIYVRFDQKFGLYSQDYRDFMDVRTDEWEELTAQAAGRRYGEILSDAEKELADAEEELAEKRAEGEEELADASLELADARKKISDGEKELADAEAEIADNKATLKSREQELADARVQIADKERELADGERELADAKQQWTDGSNEVDSAKSEVSEARSQLEAGRKELSEGRLQLQQAADAGLIPPEQFSAGMEELAAQERELDMYEGLLDAAEDEISGADEELAKSWRDIEEAEGELADGRRALEEARAEIADGEKKIREGRQELKDAEEDVQEALEELADARKELADGEREYEDALLEFQEKIRDAESELADARQELDDLEEPDTYVLGRDTNVGYVCFENDSNIVEGIANIFPVFFFLVAALVCITTMNRMVEEQRTQIGVLKALGYGEATVMSKYMVYSGLAALAGCVFGFFLGTWGFPRVIWFAYGIMYRADPISYVFDWRLTVVSLAVSLLCSIGTTWLSCRVELKEPAAVLMRPKAPRAGKRVFLEYMPFLWKRLSFLRKVSLRNIFRYKKRLFMMVLGISGCTALLVTGFGIEDSIADVAERQFQEIEIFDISVSLKENADRELKERLDKLAEEFLVESYLPVMEKTFDLVTEDGVKSIYLVAGTAESMPDYLDMHTKDGEQVLYPELGKAVISNKLAEEYNIAEGDKITLRDENMHTLSLTVSGIYENYIYNYVRISEETWRELSGTEPERKTVYVNLADGADAHALSAALMGLSQVAGVTVNADTCERVGSMMASLDFIVIVVVLCAAGLAFIVLYNLTNINITERIREIATIKVLGFYKKETSAYVFRENMLLTVLGAALGLILGKFLHGFVIGQIQVDMMSFDIYIKPVSYVYSALLTIVFTFLVNLVMGRKLEGISMTESLKSVD